MTLSLHELFRVSSDTAARVSNHVVQGTCASDALLDDLARAQRMCLDAMQVRLRQKLSILDFTSAFISRSPPPAFVSDFSDIHECMRYAVKCCEKCCTAEQMRQLVPLLRCLQSDAPNNSVLLPLFVNMGGLVAVLAWAKNTVAQLKKHPDSQSMVVLTGILHIVSKFNVLPKQTVPSGACTLLLDIMGHRLPQISACVGVVLRCWMKCAERHTAAARESSVVDSRPKLASPAARSAALPQGAGSITSVGNSKVSSRARSADFGVIHSQKLVADLCEDEAKAVHDSKRACNSSRLPTSSMKTSAPLAFGVAPSPSQRSLAQPTPGIRQASPAACWQAGPAAWSSGGQQFSSHLQPSTASCQSSSLFLADQRAGRYPASFDGSEAAHALDSLAFMLHGDASTMVSLGGHPQDGIQARPFSDYNTAAYVDYGFSEMFAPPAIQDGDFFYSDDQFLADNETMSADDINSAFLAALQQFGQRDELRGLQSLCARFR